MSDEEIIIKLNELAKAISEKTPEIIQDVAINAKALIQERIQETGNNAQEQSLNAYSESYKKIRSKRGFETAFTNLTFTGEMWRSTSIIEANQQGNKYVVSIGGNTSITKDKILWNSERYGDILRTSSVEEDKLASQVNESLNQIIKQVGL